MTKQKQTIDLREYRLFINMAGQDFDGCMNFGAIILENNGKQYPLDILSTEGYAKDKLHPDEVGEYHLFCKFEDDLDETEDMFDDMGYDFDQDISKMLHDPNTRAWMDLIIHDTTEDEKASCINIGRIKEMGIFKVGEEETFLDVIHRDGV